MLEASSVPLYNWILGFEKSGIGMIVCKRLVRVLWGFGIWEIFGVFIVVKLFEDGI